MREWWSTVFGHPRQCWSCNAPIQGVLCGKVWDTMCKTCQTQIRPIRSPGCSVCGRVEKCGDSGICFDCTRVPPQCRVVNRSVVEYTDAIKQMVHIFKYKGNMNLAEPIGLWMAELFYRELHNKGISMVTYVPLAEDRLCERGFNQARELAQIMAKKAKLPLVELLERRTSHSSQSKRGRRDRLSSVNEAFHLSKRITTDLIQNKGILIVDDVYTTGTTLRASAGPLQESGASRIYALTFAR